MITVVAPLIGSLFGHRKINGRRKRKKGLELGECKNIYHNCNNKNRNEINKLLEEGQQCISGSTNQLYCKEI